VQVKKIKILALLLAACLACGVFSACGQRTSVDVVFNMNYAGAPAAPGGLTVTVGRPYGELPVPQSRPGFAFDGWFLEKNLAGDEVTKDTIVTEDAFHTLFAKWRGNMSVTLSYDLQGGRIFGDKTLDSRRVQVGMLYSIGVPRDPDSRWGHTFLGWYLDPLGEGERIEGGTRVLTPADHTLYAVFSKSQLFYDFSSVADLSAFYFHEGYGKMEIEDGRLKATNPGSIRNVANLIFSPGFRMAAGTKFSFDVAFEGTIPAGYEAGLYFYPIGNDGMHLRQEDGGRGRPWPWPGTRTFSMTTETVSHGLWIMIEFCRNAADGGDASRPETWRSNAVYFDNFKIELPPPETAIKPVYDFDDEEEQHYFNVVSGGTMEAVPRGGGHQLEIRNTSASSYLTFLLFNRPITEGTSVRFTVDHAPTFTGASGKSVIVQYWFVNENGGRIGDEYGGLPYTSWSAPRTLPTSAQIAAGGEFKAPQDCAGIVFRFGFGDGTLSFAEREEMAFWIDNITFTEAVA